MTLFGGKPRRIDPERVILTQEQVRTIEETRLFIEKLRREPLATSAFIIVILIFWVLSLFLGAHDDPEALVRMGAKIRFLIDQGQVWRLVSPIFLHFGILHILFNGYAMFVLGRIIENLYGKRRFLLIFFFSGVASIIASYFGTARMSVGASGAIFGLLGAGVVVGYKYRDEIPVHFRRYFGRGLMPWVVLNLGLGLVIDGIDNYAHIGGLAAGTLISLNVAPQLLLKRRESVLKKTASAAAFISISAVFLLVIVAMLYNMFIDDSLPPQSETQYYHDPVAELSARIPASLVNWPSETGGPSNEFADSDLGFLVSLERDPAKIIDYESLKEAMVREVKEIPEVDEESLEVIDNREAYLDGYSANYIHLVFNTERRGLPYELEIWALPTPKGLVSVSCSSPRMFYGVFRRWCDDFVSSVRVE